MQKVMQFELTMGGTTVLQVPTGATVLRAQMRIESEMLLVWFFVPDDGASTEERTFKTFKTNQEISDLWGDLAYLGTCTCLNGEDSYHMFESV